MKALILAAGQSTRIASVVAGTPKPLIEINGKPVLAHNLELLKKHGVVDCWINLHYEPEKIQRAIGDGSSWGVSVRYSFEKEILGTAGAAKNLEKELGAGAFFLLYGDNYTDCELDLMLAAHQQAKPSATIAVFDPDKNPNSRIAGGTVLADERGRVRDFLEGKNPAPDGKRLVNAGIYILEPEIFSHIPEGFSDFGQTVFPALLRGQKKIYAYAMRGFCFAIDTPEAMKATRGFFSQRAP